MSKLPWTPAKIAWISGVSSLGRHALSDQQLAFVDALPGPAPWKLRTNFPYASPGASHAPFQASPLLWASTVSAVRFVAACQPLRRRARLDAWTALKASCDKLLLVSLSCGSQIAWSMERSRPEGARVSMLSLGPVDFGCGPIPRRVLLGTQDRVSRSPALEKAVRVTGLGHLGYTASPAVHEAASQWVEDELSPMGVLG